MNPAGEIFNKQQTWAACTSELGISRYLHELNEQLETHQGSDATLFPLRVTPESITFFLRTPISRAFQFQKIQCL